MTASLSQVTTPPPPSPGLVARLAAAMQHVTEDSPQLLRNLAAAIQNTPRGGKTPSMAQGTPPPPKRPAGTALDRFKASLPPRTIEDLKQQIEAAGGDYLKLLAYSNSLETQEEKVSFATVVVRTMYGPGAAQKVKDRVAVILGKAPAAASAPAPAAKVWTLTRSQFDSLSHADRSEWFRHGGKLTD